MSQNSLEKPTISVNNTEYITDEITDAQGLERA